jgi:tetratricopeptide (TPR) repeat protein
MSKPNPRPASLSRWQKAAFGGAVAATALIGLELLLWVVGVRPAWLDEDPYAGFSRHIPHFVGESGPDGQTLLTVAPSKRETLNPVRFTARKSQGTFRVVCVGDSTAYGRPFFDLTSFPGWLRELLPSIQPDRPWEVINAGGISYASYRIAGVMEEMSQYEPDLFIVYAGHNEFLERRTYGGLAETPSLVTSTASLASRTRIATAIRQGFDRLGVQRLRPAHRSPVLGEQTSAIPIDAVGPEAYHRDEALRLDVEKHYRASLERMVRIARASKAALLFVVPASNLAGFAPFKSEHRVGLSESELATWSKHDARARQLAESGDHEAALLEIQLARSLDDRFAALWYLEGQLLSALGRYELARQVFRRARDEDICPLRAPQNLILALRDVAAHHRVPIVDFEALVDGISPHGLPGRELFHDHVHPTLEANRSLAMAIVKELQQLRIVPPDRKWSPESLQHVIMAVTNRIDRPLYAEQLRMLSTMLAWLGQPDFSRHQAQLSFEYSGLTPEALVDLAVRLRTRGVLSLAIEFLEEAVRVSPASAGARYALALCRIESRQTTDAISDLRAALKLDPGIAEAHSNLGTLLDSQGDLAGAESCYRETVRLRPNLAIGHALLGQNLARQNRFSDAVASFQRAAELEPGSGPAQYNVGLACMKAGRWSDARRHFLQSLRLQPGQREVESRLQALDVLERDARASGSGGGR